jgi:hypothetical protein
MANPRRLASTLGLDAPGCRRRGEASLWIGRHDGGIPCSGTGSRATSGAEAGEALPIGLGIKAVDIHKPKPVHSWREAAGEIAMIVAGILIALSLEQAVESLHWRHQVEGANLALGRELAETIGQSRERERVSDCVDRRLDDLAAMVDASASSGRLPPIGPIGMPPSRTWSTGVWQSTLSGQTAEHMSKDRRNTFSVLYGYSSLLSTTNAREMDTWTRLYAMVGPGRAIEPAEAVSLRDAIGEARNLNQVMGLGAVRIEQLTAGFHIEVDDRFARTFDRPPSAYSICTPVGPPPRHYGAAPLVDAIARARRNPIGRGFAGKAVAGEAG